MLDSSDSDWDTEFGGEIGQGPKLQPNASPRQVITGVVANPGDDAEDWDEDFEFEFNALDMESNGKQSM